MKKFSLTILLSLTAFGLAGCSGGATNSSGSPNVNRAMGNVANSVINGATPNSNSASSSNANMSNSTSSTNAPSGFMNEAAQGGMAEVELGKLAASKAQNADVKKFAQKMIQDHTNANTELKQLAGKKSVTLPTDVGAENKEIMDKLSKLAGAEFDKAYVDAMVKDHEKDVALFKTQSESGTDADAKAFAAKTLPTLQSHLTMIKEIQGKMK